MIPPPSLGGPTFDVLWNLFVVCVLLPLFSFDLFVAHRLQQTKRDAGVMGLVD